jgi:hypothetical protein
MVQHRTIPRIKRTVLLLEDPAELPKRPNRYRDEKCQSNAQGKDPDGVAFVSTVPQSGRGPSEPGDERHFPADVLFALLDPCS